MRTCDIWIPRSSRMGGSCSTHSVTLTGLPMRCGTRALVIVVDVCEGGVRGVTLISVRVLYGGAND